MSNLMKSKTFRETVKIPTLPSDTNELIKLPAYPMHKAKIERGILLFEEEHYFYDVLQAGFFQLKIPDDMRIEPCDLFVNNFYKRKSDDELDPYRGFKDVRLTQDYQGYFDREHDQWENFYIEKENWKQYLPINIQESGKRLAELGITVIKNVLSKLRVDESLWGRITGGLTLNQGHQMLAFNHFRPDKPVRGTKLHRDSGWVTVLRSTEPGLLALIDGQLYAINPEAGYFTVNFGSSFEVLTQNLETPVRANIHGVVRTVKKNAMDEGRTSYVIFLDSDLSGNVYQYQNNEFIVIQSMKEFAIQEVSRTYDDGQYL